VAEQLESVEALVEDYGGSDWKAATRQEERTALWAARHNAFWAIKDKWAGKDLIATDIAVPVSNLAELVRATNADMAELGISAAPLFGHVGDGSFHLLPMFDSSDEDEVRRVKALEERMTHRAIELGGTCSGEHGIGTGKIKYLQMEHGEAAVDMMRCIKKSIDPKNIMNPQKILP
jgi:D-lactate dehydrogenase (cytochrome)